MSIKIGLRPLHDRIVVQRQKKKTESKLGIIIPESSGEKPCIGEVLLIGTGKVNSDGSTRNLSVQVGQKVLFGKWSGTALDNETLADLNVDSQDSEILVIREEDVIAIIEE